MSNTCWLSHCSIADYKSSHPSFSSITLLYIVIFTMCVGVAKPQLDGSLISCDEEGEPIEISLAAGNPCITCFCQNRTIQCRSEGSCPGTDGCHNVMFSPPTNSCCNNVCSGCTYNEMEIASGQRLTDPSDPCISMYCQGGVLTRSQDICFTPCKFPIYIPGQCCPQCQGCRYKNRVYAKSQKFMDRKDPCVTCQCQYGNIVCRKRACPELNCPPGFLVSPKQGQCCPTCSGERKVFPLTNRCLYHPHNQVYLNSQLVLRDSCRSCTCQFGTVVCEKRTCPRLNCPFNEIEDPQPGVCCARCPPPKRKCLVNGRNVRHGKTWFKDACTRCYCDDGTRHCSTEDCTRVTSNCPDGTHEIHYRQGYCCPLCVEVSATCVVFGDPHYLTFDGLLYTFQGTCEYILAQQCGSKTRDFSVKVRNSKSKISQGETSLQLRGSPSRNSYTDSVNIILVHPKMKITLHQHLRVSINSKPVTLPYIKLGVVSILQRGYSVTLTTGVGLTIYWDGLSYLEVTIPQSYKHTMCGLCGNYNGNIRDEFTGRHKVVYSQPEHFGKSWQTARFDQCSPQSCDSSKIGGLCELIESTGCRVIECIDIMCDCSSTGLDLYICYCKLFAAAKYSSCLKKSAILPDYNTTCML